MRVSTNNENAPAGWVGSLLPSLLLFAAAGWHSPTAASPADVASLKRMHALYKEKKECLPPATLQLMKWGRWAAEGDPERTRGRCHVFTCDGRNQNPRLEPGEGERAGSPAHLDRISAYLNETHHRISTGHYPFTSSSEAAEVVQSIREGDEHAKVLKRQMPERKLACRAGTSPPLRSIAPGWCNRSTQYPAVDLDTAMVSCGNGRPVSDTGLQKMLLFTEGSRRKLAFCGIPKNGCTRWDQFRRHVAGAPDYLAFPHFKTDLQSLLTLKNRGPREIKTVLTDSRWAKAVVLRDPAERVLSTWLDKFKGGRAVGFAKQIFGLDRNISFEEYVGLLNSTGYLAGVGEDRAWIAGGVDPHIAPQVWACGLQIMLRQYDFIGRVDKMPEFTKVLLDHVGLWEPWGRTYSVVGMKVAETACNPGSGVGGPGFQQRANSNSAQIRAHVMHSASKIEEYYTPALHATVRRLYAVDFELWNALVGMGDVPYVTGDQLAARLARCMSKPVAEPDGS